MSLRCSVNTRCKVGVAPLFDLRDVAYSEVTIGFVQGYALTGRYSIFPSYEAFLAIVDTMILQTAKFLKVALETRWRKDMPSLTYIETR